MTDSRSAGFTLVEVMVALAIVGLVGIGLIEAAASDLRSSRHSAAASAAASIAQDRLMRASLLAVDELAALETTVPQPFGDVAGPFDVWARAERLTERDLVEVTVRVDGSGNTLEVATRLYRPRGAAPARAGP